MESVTHVRKPASLINVAYFISLLIGALAFSTAYLSDTNAMSRKEIVCQKGFIGYSYNVKLEKRCRGLWNQWSDEIKQSFNQK